MKHQAARVDELVEVVGELDVVDACDVVGERRERLGVADNIGGDVVDRRIGERLFVERQEIGIVVDLDGDAVLGPVICNGNLPASGAKLLSVLAVDADRISRYLTNF